MTTKLAEHLKPGDRITVKIPVEAEVVSIERMTPDPDAVVSQGNLKVTYSVYGCEVASHTDTLRIGSKVAIEVLP